ncbi:type IV secretory system conjugative DNA transfer family protein [Streptomyces sp. HPF1205]|uniref:type IV secretory system conjugative DNA transfer family protein n=1 Tax=Streptomyces sp. HPF1205 TaxID=2873262 RepID=UPI001CECCA90|nr:type IV secretory system conjugative DNA transfer family protein [Streptomyces sp. HPF1205]
MRLLSRTGRVRAGDETVLPSQRVAHLLAGDRPRPAAQPAPTSAPASANLGPYPGRLGWSGPYAGRAASEARPEVFRADTSQVAGLYPFLHAGSLPPIGAYIGWNVLTMRAFSAHPSVWVGAGLVTNPNVMITGIPGSGKSAHIKALALRLMAFGTRTLIAGDVKGEYAGLCRHLGHEPLLLGPGMPGRLNPLDAGPLGQGLDQISDRHVLATRLTEIHRRRLSLLKALLELQLRRTLLAEEEEAVSAAIREVTGELAGSSRLAPPTLPAVHAALMDPTPAMAHELRVRDQDVQTTRELTRSIRAALGAMVTGHLGGLFDDETSSALDFEAPIQCVDISRMQSYGDDIVSMILTCVSSWAQAAIDTPGPPRLVVRDELWRQMRSGGASQVRKIDSDLRLSRADGTIQVLATHRLADFESVGAADSEAVAIAKDMISSCDTRVQLAQDTRPLAAIRDAVGLTDAECELISSWGKAHVGRALWRVGKAGSHPVQLHLSALEQELFHTDERMTV